MTWECCYSFLVLYKKIGLTGTWFLVRPAHFHSMSGDVVWGLNSPRYDTNASFKRQLELIKHGISKELSFEGGALGSDEFEVRKLRRGKPSTHTIYRFGQTINPANYQLICTL